MQLSRFHKVSLGHFPTPLDRLDRLSVELGIELYVKRDDLNGLAGGGNKVRKLEFLLGDALAKGADTIITQGATQSNHVRQTVAAASKLGLKSRAILEHRVPGVDARFNTTGNVFLDHLLGVESLRFVDAGADMNAEMNKEAEAVRAAGGKPYIVPGGGSNAIGALGYVNAALELEYQATAKNLKIDTIVVTSGSSGTHAGLAAGLSGLNSPSRLLGISIRQPEAVQVAKVLDETNKVAELLGIPTVPAAKIVVNDQYVGGGYGISTEASKAAIVEAAQKEALLLDPTYTGKAFGGLLDLARKGFFKRGETVVFMHTGGTFGLFAYEQELLDFLNR
ncbi:MAG: D-cysteine desulfhydrase [Candidatus Margulisiibacteriota bacterium]